MGFIIGFDLASYRADLRTRSAVERQLQNLTEAAFRLGVDAERLCLQVDWRGVRGLGNVLRHEYDEIDDAVIWEAVRNRLTPLRPAVLEALLELRRSEQEEPQ